MPWEVAYPLMDIFLNQNGVQHNICFALEHITTEGAVDSSFTFGNRGRIAVRKVIEGGTGMASTRGRCWGGRIPFAGCHGDDALF